MAEIKIVDGSIRLTDTVKNREKVKKFLKDLIDKKGLKTKSGKPSKNFKEFPKVYFGGKETEFRNKATKGDTSNKFEFANEPARTAEKNLRKQDIADANKLYSEEEVLEGKNKQKLIRKAGFEADHDIEVQEFGPARRNLDYELKSGQIDKRQFNNQIKILKDRGVGDVSKNTKQRTQSENLQKKDEVLAKNKGLAQLEAKNPSRRYNQNLFVKKDRLYQQAKKVQEKFKKKQQEELDYVYSDEEWSTDDNGDNGVNGKVKIKNGDKKKPPNGKGGPPAATGGGGGDIKVTDKKLKNAAMVIGKNLPGALSVPATTANAYMMIKNALATPSKRNIALAILGGIEAGADIAGLVPMLALPAEALSRGAGKIGGGLQTMNMLKNFKTNSSMKIPQVKRLQGV